MTPGAPGSGLTLSHICRAEQECPPTPPLLSQLNFLSSAAKFSGFSLSIHRVRGVVKKKASSPESTATSGYSQPDGWENGAAVFVKWERERVFADFWTHAYKGRTLKPRQEKKGLK